MINVRSKMRGATALCIFAGVGVAFGQNTTKSATDGADLSRRTGGNVMIGRGVMVSGGQVGGEHAEYIADADPSNPNRIMVCSMRFSQERNQLTSVAYVTSDGGRSWKLGYDDDSSRVLGVFDPACSFGENGQAYFVTLSPDPKQAESSEPNNIPYELWGNSQWRLMNVYRSADGGDTWNRAAKLSILDREDLKVDRTNGPYRGRMYLYGYSVGPDMWIVYSVDGGKTWQRSAKNTVTNRTTLMGHGTILPDSTLLLPYSEGVTKEGERRPTSYVSVASSRDGGKTLNKPVQVSTSGGSGCGGLMGMASDHSSGPFRGRAYIAWGEYTPGGEGSCSILMSYSDDKGLTWSGPVRVTDSLPRLPSETTLMPQIAVNNAGVVGVAWYDLFKSPSGNGRWLRFSASLDGGATWIPPVKVSEQPYIERSEPHFAAHTLASGGGFLATKRSDTASVNVTLAPRSYRRYNSWPGDYAAGLTAAADGRFHAFWIGNLTGRAEMYNAPITVTGKVDRFGGEALRGLEKVTSALELQVTSSVWNAAAKTLTLKYQFLNTSQAVITGPIRIRFLGIESELGTPKFLLTKTIDGPTQFLIDGANLIPATGLLPGQATKTKNLTVQYDGADDDNMTSGLHSVLRMKIEVYGVRRGTGH